MSSRSRSLLKKQTGKSFTKTIDAFAYFVGVFGNVAIIPQIIKAWQNDAPGLAVSTWILFTLMGIVWLVYGIVHKAKPLIAAQTVSILCNLFVVGGWVFNHWFV